MLTGYLLHGNIRLKFDKGLSIVGWLTSTILCLTAIFSTYEWNRGEASPSQLAVSVYAALFRLCWACAMAWVVIACQSGHGGLVNRILSWPAFVPLSRISYVAYLIHPGLMYIFIAGTRNLFAFSHYLVIQLFFSHLVSTFIVSFFLTTVIELPFVALERVIFQYFFTRSKEERKSSAKMYPVNPSGHAAISPNANGEKKNSNGSLVAPAERYSVLTPFVSEIKIPYEEKSTTGAAENTSCNPDVFVYNYKL